MGILCTSRRQKPNALVFAVRETNEDDHLGIIEHAIPVKVQIFDAINNVSYIENMEEMAGSCSPEGA